MSLSANTYTKTRNELTPGDHGGLKKSYGTERIGVITLQGSDVDNNERERLFQLHEFVIPDDSPLGK